MYISLPTPVRLRSSGRGIPTIKSCCLSNADFKYLATLIKFMALKNSEFLAGKSLCPLSIIFETSLDESRSLFSEGLMHFGTYGGAKLAGVWCDNLKHGPGLLVCGNGRQIQGDPLFLNDKPIHLDSPSTRNLLVNTISHEKKSDMKQKSSLQMMSKQIASKRSSKKFDNVDLKASKEIHVKCNPLDVPLHSVPEQVSFDYYILKTLLIMEECNGSVWDTFVFDEMSNTT